MNLDNTKTLKNLARSYVAELHDGSRYQMLSKLATTNKQFFLADILKELSTNEMAHAKVFWNFITNNNTKEVNSLEVKASYDFTTGDFNNQFGVASDVEKHTEELYLDFADIARKEGFDPVATKFEQIAQVELAHSNTLGQIYDMLTNNKLYKSTKKMVWRCTNCGHEHEATSVWATCPVCSMAQGFAKAIGSPNDICVAEANLLTY